MAKLFFMVMIVAMPAIGFSQNSWQTSSGSTVAFVIKNAGFNVHGNITGLKATVKFDPANLSAPIIEASVQTQTINTNNKSRDGHLKKEDYFNVEQFPLITLKSTGITKASASPGHFNGRFSLTIKGVSKQISIPFSFEEKGNTANMNGNFVIKRSDFGVGGNSWILSDDVTVSLQANLTR